MQTPGDKGLEESLGRKAERKGLILKTVWKTGGCASTGLSLSWPQAAGLAGSMGSAACGRDVKGWRGEVLRGRFRGPQWPGWVSAGISKKIIES